jgi:biopolymer transport protein ExbD
MNRPPAARHDPHAHVIHTPGKRLLRRVPLAFVFNRVTGNGRRSPAASLNLVSFIDFLVVTVIFLLMSFSASGQVPTGGERVPWAQNADDLLEAPLVVVNRGQILVDGVAAGSTRPVEELGRIQRIDELYNLLKSKRELWRQVQPGKPFPGVCTLVIDDDTHALVVKSVFQTAAFAGYPNVSFMVRKLPGAPAAAR